MCEFTSPTINQKVGGGTLRKINFQRKLEDWSSIIVFYDVLMKIAVSVCILPQISATVNELPRTDS